jgi:hypothetical protein
MAAIKLNGASRATFLRGHSAHSMAVVTFAHGEPVQTEPAFF